MVKLAHIVNPVKVRESSDLFRAQPITFETMKVAQEFARGQGVHVALYSAQFPEDQGMVPDEFLKTRELERSVLDLDNFQVKRKLPLIKDILDRLYEATDADYLIYTNVDIALMPAFYVAVSRLIAQGYDAFMINRRTIPDHFQTIEEIPLMYAHAGEFHPGDDCFVFPRTSYPNYEFKSVCIGAVPLGKAFTINLANHARQFHKFKDLHLTFHIGADGVWGNRSVNDYNVYNDQEFMKIVNHYNQIGKPRHPEVERYLRRRSSPMRVFKRPLKALRYKMMGTVPQTLRNRFK